ncbi:unnamed protein product, partial [marine sediment metagenome]
GEAEVDAHSSPPFLKLKKPLQFGVASETKD